MQPSPPMDTNCSASGKGAGPCEDGPGPCEDNPSVGCMRCLLLHCSLCLQDPGEADCQGEGQGEAGLGESGGSLPAAWQGVGRAVHRSQAHPEQAQVGGVLLVGQGKWFSCGCPQYLPPVPVPLYESPTCFAIVSVAEKPLRPPHPTMVPASLKPSSHLLLCAW